MKDHWVFFFRAEKKKNVVKVKTCLSSPEASADLQTASLEQNLVDSGMNPGIPLFRRSLGFGLVHGLVLHKFSRECTLWALGVNKPYKIEILINQAVMNHTVRLSPRGSINPVQGVGWGGRGAELTAFREPHMWHRPEQKCTEGTWAVSLTHLLDELITLQIKAFKVLTQLNLSL